MKRHLLSKSLTVFTLLLCAAFTSQAVITVRITGTQTKPSCVGSCDATINVNATGGVAPYTYLWNTGATSQNLNSLCAGTYTVTATDCQGHSATQTRTIRDPYPVKVTLTANNVTCNGNCDGSLVSNVTGGTAPYSYQWSNGATTPTLPGLCPGTYTVTVTDSLGCQADCQKAITQKPAVNASVSKVNATCFGGCNGSASVTASGGVAPYTYLWSNGSQLNTATDLCAAVYTVVVTDSKGCSITKTVTIGQPADDISLTVSVNHSICVDACNGSLSANATGGNGTFSYLWSTGESTKSISGLCAGIYTVTATDCKGCSKTLNFELTAVPVTVAVTDNDVTCNGLCNGSAGVMASGTGPVSYLWSNSSTSSSLSDLCPGNYTVTVTDSLGCKNKGYATIAEPQVLAAVCHTLTNETAPGMANGSMDVTVSGGTQPYQIVWSNGSSSPVITGLAAGTYTATVTDGNGCTAVTSCSVTTNAQCGGFRTQTQGGWGQCQLNGNNPGQYLHDNFAAAFPNGLTIGCTYTIHLSSSTDVCSWLPSTSTPRALTQNYNNPAGVYANVLAGQVATLAISAGFDKYDAGFGSSGTLLENQVITTGTFKNWTVKQLLDTANKVLGGCPSLYTASAINGAVSSVNENYDDGVKNKGFLACPASGVRMADVTPLNALVYPNPFNTDLSVSIGANRTATVYVTDLAGKVSDSFQVTGDMNYAASKLAPGVYLLNIKYMDGVTEVVKVVRTN